MLKAKVNMAVSVIHILKLSYAKDPDKRMSANSISNKVNFSISALETIVAVLKRNGIVNGLKGPHGGYLLIPDNYENLTIREFTSMFYPYFEEDNSVKHFTKSFLRTKLWTVIK